MEREQAVMVMQMALFELLSVLSMLVLMDKVVLVLPLSRGSGHWLLLFLSAVLVLKVLALRSRLLVERVQVVVIMLAVVSDLCDL